MAAKIFEVGDVLPATTQLRISWVSSAWYNFNSYFNDKKLRSDNNNYYILNMTDNGNFTHNYCVCDIPIYLYYADGRDDGEYYEPYTDGYGSHSFMDIDISTWSLTKRTISYCWFSSPLKFYWEVLGTIIPNGYSITYEENGGSTVTDLTEQTALPSPLPTTTKSGYTFMGWYYDDDFTTQAYAEDELEDDVTLYAKWILNTYTITYNTNGGSSVSQTSNATQLPDPLPLTTKIGFTFVAWYYESNFQTRAKAGDTIESNVTLYAKWHNLGSLFTEIADAIRSKDGTSENIRDVDFGERIKQIQPAKEEQTKTVSPTTSSQDVLPDANKVLSKVTVNAIPTETKSQQPNLSSGDQTINATSGKFMTSFTITKDTTNHIASNIRSGKTLYGVTGNLQPAKEEETKTVTPNFSSGNFVVTPTTGKVLSQVTINKDANLLAENIKSGVTIFGVTGTLEPAPSGYTVDIVTPYTFYISQSYYSLDNGVTWVLIPTTQQTINLTDVTQIKFKVAAYSVDSNAIASSNIWTSGSYPYPSKTNPAVIVYSNNYAETESANITLTENKTYYHGGVA